MANLPPVSTIPVENFPPVSTTPVGNCHRYQRHRRQICTGVNYTGGKQWEQLSNCWQLKMNLNKIFFLYANSTTQRCPKEIIKNFRIEDFFHLPPVSLTILAVLLKCKAFIGEAFLYFSYLWRAFGAIMYCISWSQRDRGGAVWAPFTVLTPSV